MKDPNPQKILIIHAWGIGDLVMFTPALKALREKLPQAKIDVFITYQPVVAEVLTENRTVNRIFKFFWRKKDLLSKIKLLYQLRKEKYDWAIVTAWTNHWKGGVLAFLAGAKLRVGTYEGWRTPFYTHQVLREEDRPQVEQNLDLLRILGLEIKEAPLPFFEVGSQEEDFAQNWIKQIGVVDKILIGFHPGAEKVHSYLFWPKEYFIELGKKIVGNYQNIRLIIFGGPGEEELCQEIKEKIGENPIRKDKFSNGASVFLATGFSLKEVAALIDKCQVFVASDSGLGHMAGTTKTNLISIFGPSNPKRSAPRGPKVRVISETCRHRYAENRIHSCLKKITPEMVFKEIEKILEKEKGQIS